MIGHTYKKLGNTPQAMIHYSWAMELDPKGANTHLRDIMTNPPITNRTSNRQGTSEPGICGGVTGSVSGSSVGVGSVGGSQSTVNNSARAHLGAFQAGIRGNFAAEEQEQGEEEEEEEDESEVIDRTSGTDEETMNNSLLHHPSSQSGGGGGTRSNHLVRRLTDFSLLYESGAGSFGVGSYEQDSVMSDPDEEHYDTMDIGGNGVDNSNNRTEHSISDD
ncbi:unnamed protein product [Trichobilharzia regenti]|nr:unnamed protein product [Trichobilharzia regenti]